MPQAVSLRPRRQRHSPWPGKSGPGGWVRLGAATVAVLFASVYLATHMQRGDLILGLGLTAGVGLTTWFASSVRYEVTLTVFALYVCLLDGFIKLRTDSANATFIRDVLLAAIVLGAAARMYIDREKIKLPPLAPWVLGFIVFVLLQVFNPGTLNTTKALAGVRQQLEFVPLYFLGFAVLRTKMRLRNLLILIALVATINGIVGLIQVQLTPEQLSSWGPGYKARIEGTDVISGRTFQDAEGQNRVRPFALGSDFGFGGALGLLALPMTLAFLTLGGLGKRMVPMALLGIGSAVAIITSQGRTVVIGGVLVVLSFFFLGLAGKRAVRTVGAVAVGLLIAVVVLPAVFSGTQKGTFDRYATIKPNEVVDTAYSYRIDDLSYMVQYVTRFPLGAGLGTVGPARAFGGGRQLKGINGETEFNFLMLELGIPGLLLLLGLWLNVIGMIVRRLPKVEDLETRSYLAGFFAPLPVLFLLGFAGPNTAAPPFPIYFWLAVGVAAYWLTDASGALRKDDEIAEVAHAKPPRRVSPAAVAASSRRPRRRSSLAELDLLFEDRPPPANPAEEFDVSICLYSEGDLKALRRAVDRIGESGVPAHEILLVAADVDAEKAAAFSLPPNAHWVAGSATGIVGGWNMAVLEATGSHVLLLRDDLRLDPGFLPAVRDHWAGLSEPERISAVFAGSELHGARRIVPLEQTWLGYPSRPYKPGEPLKTVVVTSAVFPQRLLSTLLLDSQLHLDYAGIDIASRAVASGATIVACPDAYNWAPPKPRRKDEDEQREASRIEATLKRRTNTDGSMGKGTLYYMTAATHLYASEFGRHGFRGLGRASKALGKARTDLGR